MNFSLIVLVSHLKVYSLCMEAMDMLLFCLLSWSFCHLYRPVRRDFTT